VAAYQRGGAGQSRERPTQRLTRMQLHSPENAPSHVLLGLMSATSAQGSTKPHQHHSNATSELTPQEDKSLPVADRVVHRK